MWLEGSWAGTQWRLLKCGHCGNTCPAAPLWHTDLPVPSFPPKFHNQLPGNKKRCVLITRYWCNTQVCPLPPPLTSPWHQTYTASERNTQHILTTQLWSVLPKKSVGAYQIEPHLPYEPIAASQTGFKTNQTAKQHRRKSASALSQPPPLTKMVHPTQEQSVPPWVVWGGTSMLCVSCKCMCLSQRE